MYIPHPFYFIYHSMQPTKQDVYIVWQWHHCPWFSITNLYIFSLCLTFPNKGGELDLALLIYTPADGKELSWSEEASLENIQCTMALSKLRLVFNIFAFFAVNSISAC